MTDQVRVFTRDGIWVDQPRTSVERSWALTTETSAKFRLSVFDAKCNPFTYNYGCPILVENNEGLPDWVGMIDGRSFGNGSLIVTAYTPERWLLYRRGPTTLKLKGTAGSIFTHLLQYAEGLENTVLAVGDIDSDTGNMEEILNPGTLLSANLKKIVQSSGEGYRWRAEVVKGKLTIYGDWFANMTLDTGLILVDGFNISGEHPLLESPPINNVLTYGNGNDWSKRLTATQIDADSIEDFGLRQMTLGVSTDKKPVLDAAATVNLNVKKRPRYSFPLSVLNTNETFSKLAPGVKADWTRSVGQGFSGNELGYTSISIFIRGMNYNPEKGYVGLQL